MSCSNKAPLKIVKGEDRVLNIHISDEDTGGDYDLTSATEITVKFKKTDLSALSKTMGAGAVSIVSAVAGKIQVTLTDTDTALLLVGDQDIYVEVDIGSAKRIVTEGLENSIEVIATPF